MNHCSHFRAAIVAIVADLAAAGRLPAGLDLTRLQVDPPRDPTHGDLSTNAAMVLAKPARIAPRALAQLLVEALVRHPEVAGAEIAGPGFVNLRLKPAFWPERLREVLAEGLAYGRSNLGQGRPINVEYVSANPTGPMHVGHGRGAVVGDALAALLERTGYAVTREYYVNDAGAQVDALARSAHLRYREALGETIGEIPEGLYPGDYLKPVGAALAAREGARWRDCPEEAWLTPVRDFAVAAMLDLIREDLAALGVRHDVFVSERKDIVAHGRVDEALGALEAAGHLYVGTLEPPKGLKPEDWEARPQTLFRSTAFGDDVDRPIRKSDGSWTYFAADIAYHLDKVRRGFAELIDVWGADHGGYVKRMQAAVTALTGGAARLDVKLCQLVNLLKGGEPVKMSKRSGNFVTLREVIDEVGAGAVRFIMLTRKNDQHLDFDLAKVTEQSKDNPVFYVQYAHARSCSVRRQAEAVFPGIELGDATLAAAALDRLVDPDEIALIRSLADWPRQVEAAAEAHEPHRIAFYLYELASAFHALWTRGKEELSLRFVVPEDRALTLARLALVRGVGVVIAAGLGVMGVAPLEEMR